MRRYFLSSVFIVLLVVGFLVWHGKSTPKPSLEYPLNSSKLRSFLESQYVPEANLLRAAVKAYPDNETIYIANDNLLASRALVALGSPIGRRILENLNANYSGGWSGKVDPLPGRPIAGFYCVETRNLGKVYSKKFNATFEIKYEIANTSCRMEDWESYADLLVYGALNELINGNESGALEIYSRLLGMWDGNGFRDRAFDGTYQTYKCALFVYLYRALGKPKEGGNVYSHCLNVISSLQAENGGIITGYWVENGKIAPVGDTNTETTSMVVLAVYSGYPTTIKEVYQT
ncbi:hypothetical protein [Thermococcus pacificus]|uniref:Uncharacterized protein n=1 Tax=Thermococcus pacificus TaxID=71998 RepID=A0A218P9V0_9EURY|nr:hypothetical protein [Thermococcus pacificus]ASJ07552.1 hypothetical protein A3L08_09590 [Thermococcus pacificus]